MDFKKITENMGPLINQAKTYGAKALQFTQKQAQNTAIFLKTEEEYNIAQTAKRAIFIAYDETNPLSEEILLRSPVWTTKAWMDTAEVRFLSITASPDLARTL
jgi:putative SOS response-associated peptidase YedK